VIELSEEISERLLRNILNSLTHTDLFHGEFACSHIVIVEIKLVVIEVFAETDMVRCMSKDAFIFNRDVDTSLTVGLDLTEPLVA